MLHFIDLKNLFLILHEIQFGKSFIQILGKDIANFAIERDDNNLFNLNIKFPENLCIEVLF